MSVQAIAWVLEDAPDLPPHLVSTLLGLANHAGADGCGAYPSQSLLAHYARKNDRQVRKDLDALEELGLIRRGNQKMVLHLAPDKRPVVWDLAMHLHRPPRPDRARPGRRAKGQVNTPANSTGPTGPPESAEESTGPTGGNRPGPQGKNGRSHRSDKPFFEPSQEPTPPTPPKQPRADRPSTPGSKPGGEFDKDQKPQTPEPETDPRVAELAAELLEQVGWDPRATTRALTQVLEQGRRTWPQINAVMRRVAFDPSTQVPGRLLAVPEAWWTEAAERTERAPKPPWCEDPDCDPGTRMRVPTDGGRAARCPQCHPLTAGAR
jgi:hypothetical protein